MPTAAGFVWSCARAVIACGRFTDLDGKRAQMEFAKIGDRDSAAADVLRLSSACHKAREEGAFFVAIARARADMHLAKQFIEPGARKRKIARASQAGRLRRHAFPAPRPR